MTAESDNLAFAGAAAQARMISEGEVSAREVVEATLRRIDAVNPLVNAYRVVMADQALHEADSIDRDRWRPGGDTRLLLGVPVAVKDTVDVVGQVTTWGTGCNSRLAAADSPIVASLRAAGAIIIGKTTLAELAAWPFTETDTWGATRNPWDLSFSPGGSSGGSAVAVAAGLCGLALGSDGLGSIRAPAGFTGVFGLKPQRGRVWHDACDWTGLAVNGPLARCVADAALFLDATATTPGGFAALLTHEVRPLRIAVAWKPLVKFPITARLGAEQRRVVEETMTLLAGLGHAVVERELDMPMTMANSGMIRYLAGVADSVAVLDDPDLLAAPTRRLASYGRRLHGRSLRWAMANEEKSATKLRAIFDDIDVVLTPGAVRAPLRIGAMAGKGASRALMASGSITPHYSPWNVIGHPAASIPAGFSATGLPLSVQLAGRPHDEATLLSLAAQLETARPWAQRRPSIGDAAD
jgi:amidase